MVHAVYGCVTPILVSIILPCINVYHYFKYKTIPSIIPNKSNPLIQLFLFNTFLLSFELSFSRDFIKPACRLSETVRNESLTRNSLIVLSFDLSSLFRWISIFFASTPSPADLVISLERGPSIFCEYAVNDRIKVESSINFFI